MEDSGFGPPLCRAAAGFAGAGRRVEAVGALADPEQSPADGGAASGVSALRCRGPVGGGGGNDGGGLALLAKMQGKKNSTAIVHREACLGEPQKRSG